MVTAEPDVPRPPRVRSAGLVRVSSVAVREVKSACVLGGHDWFRIRQSFWESAQPAALTWIGGRLKSVAPKASGSRVGRSLVIGDLDSQSDLDLPAGDPYLFDHEP
jgi:hypothetical protein